VGAGAAGVGSAAAAGAAGATGAGWIAAGGTAAAGFKSGSRLVVGSLVPGLAVSMEAIRTRALTRITSEEGRPSTAAACSESSRNTVPFPLILSTTVTCTALPVWGFSTCSSVPWGKESEAAKRPAEANWPLRTTAALPSQLES
jgi:hypothetical protein